MSIEQQIAVLAWLHAELAYKHVELVKELQTLIAQAIGPTGMSPARAQQLRGRAQNLARIRNQQQRAAR